MAINITNYAAKLDEVFQVSASAKTFAESIDTDLDLLVNEFTTESVEVRAAIKNVLQAKNSIYGSLGTLISALARVVEELTVATVTEDDPNVAINTESCLEELIRQFEAQSVFLEQNTVSVSTSAGTNVGNGNVVAICKNKFGQTEQLALAETIEVEFLGASTSRQYGERDASTTSPLWPAGSGTSTNMSRRQNLITNGNFATSDSVNSAAPANWLISGTPGTRIVHTPTETQTVEISGTPTTGTYTLLIVIGGKTYQTSYLAYSATASEVQSAIQGLPGLEQASVTSTGTTPNFTHTITLTGTKNPGQFTSIENFDSGSIAHATLVAGSAETAKGARAIQFTGDNSEQTAIYQQVSLQANTIYSVSALAKRSGTGAGSIAIDLVDSIGGTILADDASTNNQIATTVSTISNSAYSAIGGFFITPKSLPSTIYLRVWQSTALAASQSVYVDNIYLSEAQQAYSRGPFIEAISGSVDFAVDDTFTVTVANNYAGSMQTNLAWALNTKTRPGKDFPTAAAGAPGVVLET